jgi:mono/diheme cytochrome c family protein
MLGGCRGEILGGMKRDSVIIGLLLGIAVLVGGIVGVIAWEAGNAGSSVQTVTVAGTGGTTGTSGTAVSEDVAAGAHDFVTFACAECHGVRGAGGVSPDVPALADAGQALTVAELTRIIQHGLGESANPAKPYMPVWNGVVSKSQVADLVAYIRAGLPEVAGAEPVAVPEDQGAAVAGALLYQRYGCGNCHGPNGLGGVPNPAAPDHVIPALSGGDFRGEFDTDAKIKEMIRSGSVLGKAPIVSMPHWGGILTNVQLDQLVAYLKTLG